MNSKMNLHLRLSALLLGLVMLSAAVPALASDPVRIRTTELKAKELRRVIEPLVTLAAKQNDVAARRLAFRVLNDRAVVKRLFDEIAKPFAGVPGGYTRILKLATPRKGDNAPMCYIEFTNYQAEAKADVAPAEAPKADAAPAEAPKADA